MGIILCWCAFRQWLCFWPLLHLHTEAYVSGTLEIHYIMRDRCMYVWTMAIYTIELRSYLFVPSAPIHNFLAYEIILFGLITLLWFGECGKEQLSQNGLRQCVFLFGMPQCNCSFSLSLCLFVWWSVLFQAFCRMRPYRIYRSLHFSYFTRGTSSSLASFLSICLMPVHLLNSLLHFFIFFYFKKFKNGLGILFSHIAKHWK